MTAETRQIIDKALDIIEATIDDVVNKEHISTTEIKQFKQKFKLICKLL